MLNALLPQSVPAVTRPPRRQCCSARACVSSEARASPLSAVLAAGVLLFSPVAAAPIPPASALDLGSADAALVLESQLQDTLQDAAAVSGDILATAAGAAADAAPVVLDAVRAGFDAAAPVAAEGARVAGSLAWEGAKAAAPYVEQGLKLAGSAALEGAKAAAPYVQEGLKVAGSAALEAATAAAPVVRDGVVALGAAAVDTARSSWDAVLLSDAAKGAAASWTPICCQTNSCIAGPAACGAPAAPGTP